MKDTYFLYSLDFSWHSFYEWKLNFWYIIMYQTNKFFDQINAVVIFLSLFRKLNYLKKYFNKLNNF